METILYTLAVLVVIGLVAAALLYVISQRFQVIEDPRIDEVEGALPGANCGGCGYPGCRGFADAFVKADDITPFFCPVGGNAVMSTVAGIVGKAAAAKAPMVAVVRCSGSPSHRPSVIRYDGAGSCRVSSALYEGHTGCAHGCLGMGDCTGVCDFGAIRMNPETHLPEVDESLCTGCGACVKVCPKRVIELRNQGPKGRRVFVSCVNKEKGGVAKKSCGVACIGCGKCVKACPFEAITLENNLAYIDFSKCKMCRKCVEGCPTGAIHEVNFPPKPVKPAAVPDGEKRASSPAASGDGVSPAVSPQQASAGESLEA